MLVTREEWGFRGPLGDPMALPAREVWLHHSVTNPTSDPMADMRALERIGQSRFGMLSYSFAVHPNGTVLEGQGTNLGAHTGGHNSISFGIVWIGNYESQEPTRALIQNTAALLRLIKSQGWGPGQLTGGHRDTKQTSCPGRFAYASIPDINALAAQRVSSQTPQPAPNQETPDMILWRANDGTGRVWVVGPTSKMYVKNATRLDAYLRAGVPMVDADVDTIASVPDVPPAA